MQKYPSQDAKSEQQKDVLWFLGFNIRFSVDLHDEVQSHLVVDNEEMIPG
jgi:hypothetical protein